MGIVKGKVYLVASDIVTCPAVTAGEERYSSYICKSSASKIDGYIYCTSQGQSAHADTCNSATNDGELLFFQLAIHVDPTITGLYPSQRPVLRDLYLIEVC